MKKFISVLVACGVFTTGCSTIEIKRPVVEKASAMVKGPESKPFRSITGFSDGLRCMDDMMITYGVRDVVVLVEDLLDTTKKMNAGTKDMLISAVSDISKRSRAIRLITFGMDSGNLANFLANAEQKGAYSVVPDYDIRGSISQFDESLAKKQIDASINIGQYGIGAAKTAQATVLGLDLNMISTKDYSVINGVTARNSVIIFKEGSGADAEAQYRKLGINFGLTLTKNEGQSQALRNLVELAVIELFGKLTKIPYWKCLGADPSNEAIKNEISDWFYAMSVNNELLAYTQKQLRMRGYYYGPIDGQVNQKIINGLAKYRAALGLSEDAKLDLDFFQTYLSANHQELVAKFPSPFEPEPEPIVEAPQVKQPQSSAEKPSTATSDTQPVAQGDKKATTKESAKQAGSGEETKGQKTKEASETKSTNEKTGSAQPLKVALSSNKAGDTKFKRGELIQLTVAINRDAHLYCYIQDENHKIQRFYPNRFSKDSFVRATTPVQIPGDARFQIVANDKGAKEEIACFATDKDIFAELPRTFVGIDFEDLPATSLEQIRGAFQNASKTLAEGYFHVETN